MEDKKKKDPDNADVNQQAAKPEDQNLRDENADREQDESNNADDEPFPFNNVGLPDRDLKKNLGCG